MKTFSFCLFAVLMLVSSFCFSQREITGKLIDEVGNPLIGASIIVIGSDPVVGGITDLDGNFVLSIDTSLTSNSSITISCSYVGFSSVKKMLKLADSWENLTITLLDENIHETIVVTEGKYEKVLEESTVSIDVIDVKQLESNNVTSLDEIVQKASGVQIVDGQISIRGGSGYAYGVGSRVMFLVDGQPLLSAELSDVKWNFMPIENAAQIEIIKGSSSVLYGSGALNGVVNLQTAYPKGDKPYTAISMYAGIYDQPKIDSMRWYKPEEEAAAVPMFAGLYFAHRQRPHKNLDVVLGGNFHFKNGYYKGADERRFRFNFNTRYRVPKSDGRISMGINGNVMYHEEGRFFMSKDMKENAYINLSPIFRDRYVTISLDPYVTIFDKQKNKHDIRGRWFRVSKQQEGPGSDADLMSLEYQFQREFAKKWVVTAGVKGQYLHVNSVLFADVNAHWSERVLFTGGSIAAYAQVDKKFWDRLSVTLGLRWEGFVVDTSFMPALPIVRAGLNLEASKNDFIRLSFGQGFRLPSMAERFFNEKIPGTIIAIKPNHGLLPETGWSTEIGYRHTFRVGKFKLYADIAFFWMEYENMVEFALVSGGFQFINISKARIAGWEISAQSQGKIGKVPIRIWGGYTYSYPGDLSSNTSPMRDPGEYMKKLFTTFANGVNRATDLSHILKYRVIHTFRLDAETEYKGVTFGTAVNYSSFMQNIDLIFEFGLISQGVAEFRALHNKGYWLWDLRLGYRFNDKQRINFVVQNVLNEEYSTRPAQMGIPRSFSLKYSHVF